MLADYPDRVRVVEPQPGRPRSANIDVVLFDVLERDRLAVSFLQLVYGIDTKVVVFTWQSEPAVIVDTLGAGAAEYLWKGASAHEILRVVEGVSADGQRVGDTPGSMRSTARGWRPRGILGRTR